MNFLLWQNLPLPTLHHDKLKSVIFIGGFLPSSSQSMILQILQKKISHFLKKKRHY